MSTGPVPPRASIVPSGLPDGTPPPDEASSRRGERYGDRDAPGVAMGLVVALLVHGGVVTLSLRLGRNEGNVARAAARPPQDETILEARVLQRGGGSFDPRRIVHRQAPIQAERTPPPRAAPTRDPTAVTLRADAGAEDYMAAITNRNRTGRGNQDLAERLAHMAASEQADPEATGPGAATGSRVGDTTDPSQATQGPETKIRAFFLENLRITTTIAGAPRNVVAIRFRLGEGGTVEEATVAEGCGNESLDGDLLNQVQALATRHARIPDLTPEEATRFAGRNIRMNIDIRRVRGQ